MPKQATLRIMCLRTPTCPARFYRSGQVGGMMNKPRLSRHRPMMRSRCGRGLYEAHEDTSRERYGEPARSVHRDLVALTLT